MKNKSLVYYLTICLSSSPLLAATWTNEGGDSDWFNGSNWQGSSVPVNGTITSSVGTEQPAVIGADSSGSSQTYAADTFSLDNMAVQIAQGGKVDITGDGDVVVIGQKGSGSLIIEDGGEMKLNAKTKQDKLKFYIGLNQGSEGTVTVNEGGSLFIATPKSASDTNGGALVLGQNGTGTLNINGGKVDSNHVWIGGNGANGGAIGTANVTSGELKARTNLHIGNTEGAQGTLNISGTGSVSGTNVTIGNQKTSSGEVNVSDQGTLTSIVTMVIGSETGATGTLNISGEGTVKAQLGTVTVANSAASGDYAATSGTINLKDKGKLLANTINLGNKGTGTLNISSAEASILRTDGTAGTTIKTGTGSDAKGIINFQHQTGTLNFDSVIGSSTTANKIEINHLASGTTILSGNNTYANGTTITAGTLVAANENALGIGDVTINGGKLQLDSGLSKLVLGGNLYLTSGELVLNVFGEDNYQSIVFSPQDVVTFSDSSRIVLGEDFKLTIDMSSYDNLVDGASFNINQLFEGVEELDVQDFGTVQILGSNGVTGTVDTDGTIHFAAIPESSTSTLFILSLCGLAMRRSRKPWLAA